MLRQRLAAIRGPLSVTAFVLAALAFGFGLVFWRDNLNEPDCLYHAAHSRIYWEHGPFFRDFPWGAFSIISRERADLWWGFHVLFAPIGLVRDAVLSMRGGMALAAALHVLVLGLAYRRLSLSPWWAFGSATVSAGLTVRLAMLRPQVLSSALIPLLFAELWRRSVVGATVAGALLGLLHPTLAYVLLPLFPITAIGAGRGKSKAPEIASFVATLACVFARPGPVAGASLLKVQTWDLFMLKRLGVVLDFGVELYPTTVGYFVYGVAVPLALLAFGLLYARRAGLKGPAVATLLLTAIFLGVFLVITKRGVDQVAPFAFLTFALLVTARASFPRGALAAALVACAVSLWGYHRDMVRHVEPLSHRLEGAGAYLASHVPENSVVYHTVWSDFGPLLFWNPRNRYVGGMDPIFQWAVSSENYWMCTPAHPERPPGTVGRAAPGQGPDIPLWRALPEYFGTKWLVAGHGLDGEVIDALRADPKHWAERYSAPGESVFEIVGSD